jgi:hypothetical protein
MNFLEQLMQMFQQRRKTPSDLMNEMYSYSDTPGQAPTGHLEAMHQRMRGMGIEDDNYLSPQEMQYGARLPRSIIEQLLRQGLDIENNQNMFNNAARINGRNELDMDRMGIRPNDVLRTPNRIPGAGRFM